MSKKRANHLIHSNNENTKSEGERDDSETAHENVYNKVSNQSGWHKTALQEWSKEKLIEAAETLEFPDAKELSREELILKILRANEPQKKA